MGTRGTLITSAAARPSPPPPRSHHGWGRARPVSSHVRDGGRLVHLDLDAQILSHDFLDVVTGAFQPPKPAVVPVADTGEPCGASAAGPRFGAPALEVEPPVPVESLTLPDVPDRRL